MLILSSPSGAGKTTLAKGLLESEANLDLSVSVTTRPPRRGEAEGIDYFYLSHDAFRRDVEAGELLEWAQVFGNLYGTPRRPVEKMLALGHDVLFDIDWQGARQLRQRQPEDVVSVFILPPSGNILRERLKDRGQDSDTVIARRMAEAASEISHWPEYDYVVVNAGKDACQREVAAILTAERLRRTRRRTGLAALAGRIVGELS